MKNQHSRLRKMMSLVLLVPALSAVTMVSAHADEPGRHAFYAHAEADLHQARWLLEHRPGDNWEMGRNEHMALEEIDRASAEIMQLGTDVGKDMYRPQHADVHPDRRGRLHDAAVTLQQVREDLMQQEDDPRVRGLQRDALRHVDIALHATRDAMRDAGY
jgi:hypothetical protein